MESTKLSGEENLNGLADDLRRRIAEAAYELYERHGREDGRDVEDWLQAEAIVTDQYPKHPEGTWWRPSGLVRYLQHERGSHHDEGGKGDPHPSMD